MSFFLYLAEGNNIYQSEWRLSLPKIIVITFTIVIGLILLSTTVTCVYLRKRRYSKPQGKLFFVLTNEKKNPNIKGDTSSAVACNSNPS